MNSLRVIFTTTYIPMTRYKYVARLSERLFSGYI